MNLFFDLDGTLADPMNGFRSSLVFSFEKNGLMIPDEATLRKCIGPPLHLSIESLMKVPKDKAEKVLTDFREHHQSTGIYQYRFYDGAEAVLKKLGQKHQIFLATSKPIYLTLPLMQHFGFAPLFKGIYGSEMNGQRSQKAELLKHILETEKISPAETIMIGDREHDANGAKANGVKAYGVTWGFGSADELKYAGVEKLFNNWFQLLESLI